jgi:hypothetical protein
MKICISERHFFYTEIPHPFLICNGEPTVKHQSSKYMLKGSDDGVKHRITRILDSLYRYLSVSRQINLVSGV